MALTFVAQSHTPCRRKPALFDALSPKSQLQEAPERAGLLLGTDRDCSRPSTTPKTLSGFCSRRLSRLCGSLVATARDALHYRIKDPDNASQKKASPSKITDTHW